MNKVKFEDYHFEIRPLSQEEGGGYLITFPDLPGCMSDGDTPDEATGKWQGCVSMLGNRRRSG